MLASPMAASSSASTAQQKRVLTIIWFAMVVAVVCYSVVERSVSPHLQKSGAMPAVFPVTLIAQSVLLFGGAWWWFARTITAVTAQAAPTAIQRLGPQERRALRARLQQTTIICLACMEAPAVFGLVNSFVASPYPRLFGWLAGASLISLLLFRISGYPAIFAALDKLDVRG